VVSKRVRLAQRRKAAGFSQERLAHHLGVERTTVVRWENAETEPQPWYRPPLAKAIKVTGEELQALLDDIVITREEPNERMSYVLEHPGSVDLVVVAYLHEGIRALDEWYDQSPSAALLGRAGHTHGQVAYLREHATDPRVRRALFEVEAASATFMGQLVWDVSQRRDHVGPVTYFDDAVRAARQVRDPCAESYAVLRKSFVALYGEKDPVKGRTLAQEAADVAKMGSPAMAGLSLLHVGEGYAMTGDVSGCEDALRKAETQFDKVTPDDMAAEYYTVNEFKRLAGSCYLFLDLPDRAQPILEETVRALATKKSASSMRPLRPCTAPSTP
jgi:transcriptional regulator with XRE-family HTH domain